MIRSLAILACLAPMPVEACRLALVLALDVSSSVDEAEYRLQTHGLAWALETDVIQSYLFQFPQAPVAVHVFEWSGRFRQSTILDWTQIRSPGDLAFVTNALRTAERSETEQPTAIGHALGHARRQFSRGPDCARQVIDISGDGLNNDGIRPDALYEMTTFDPVTVNGLPVGDGEVAGYYYREVIRGPGAFVEWAMSYENFAAAMARKLEREIKPPELSKKAPRNLKKASYDQRAYEQ